VSQAGDSKNPR